MKKGRSLLAAVLVAAAMLGIGTQAPVWHGTSPDDAGVIAPERAPSLRSGQVGLADLPVEVRETLDLVRRDGPFPYARDGAVFHNREGLLPPRRTGYYAEYTVVTPGARDRGARRLVVGGWPRGAQENYYTDDHYRSFRLIVE